jgi:hypothetical protein
LDSTENEANIACLNNRSKIFLFESDDDDDFDVEEIKSFIKKFESGTCLLFLISYLKMTIENYNP